jgi:plasmid stabilization system protein ParE
VKRVLVTPSVRGDLLAIWEYIARDSIRQADRVIAAIQSSFQKLAESPGIGHTRRELDPVYRVWCVYTYLIVYRPDADPIQVIRVVSGYRDLNRLTV